MPFRLLMTFLRDLLLSVLFLATYHSKADSQDSQQSWNFAGIRAAFGDSREPYVEPSTPVQHAALKLCAERHLGAAFDAQEVAAYLDSSDPLIRSAALSVLGQMGKGGERFVKDVVDVLEKEALLHSSPKTSPLDGVAADTLVKLGIAGVPVGKEVAPLLAHENSFVREDAVFVFGNIDGAGNAFSKVVELLLYDPMESVRDAAVNALGAMGRNDLRVVNEVVQLRRDHRETVRAAAARSLGLMGKTVTEFAPAIAPLLKDHDATVRVCGAVTLVGIPNIGLPIVKDIAFLLNDPKDEVRTGAAEALGMIGSRGAPFAKDIAVLLKDHDDEVRGAAVTALGQMGERAAGFDKDVAKLLKDESPLVRAPACLTLSRFGKRQASFVPEIAALLADKNSDVCNAAVYALAHIGSGARPFGRKVAEALARQVESEIFASPFLILSNQPPHPERMAFSEEIADLLESKNARTRAAAVRLIGEMGRTAGKYSNRVTRLLGDKSGYVQSEAAIALSEIGSVPAIPEIARLLDDKSDSGGSDGADPSEQMRVLGAAVYALGQMGEAGRAFAKKLASSINYECAKKGSQSSPYAAFGALDRWGNPHCDWELQAELLSISFSVDPQHAAEVRAHLRLWSGADAALQRSVTWLTPSDVDPMPKEGLSENERREVVAMFSQILNVSAGQTPTRSKLMERISEIVSTVTTKPDKQSAEILDRLFETLKRQGDHSAAYEALKKAKANGFGVRD